MTGVLVHRSDDPAPRQRDVPTIRSLMELPDMLDRLY
jgi:hypothetical protein